MDIVSPNDSSCNDNPPRSENERLIRAYCQEHGIDFNLFCQKMGLRFIHSGKAQEKQPSPHVEQKKVPLPVRIEPKSQTYSTNCLVDDEYELIRRATNRDYWRYRLTGVSAEVYYAAFHEQNGLCAACGREETATFRGRKRQLAADHDHVTGKFRGLLCGKCNSALGLLKDDPERIRALADYIEKHLTENSSGNRAR